MTEDFEAQFPAWETGWLGINSNLQNYYGVGAGRGNNPDGLWLDDGDGVTGSDIVNINFDSAFGASITQFSIDTTTWSIGATFEAYDMFGATIYSTLITVMQGAHTDPGIYQSISFSSLNGVSRFSFFGGDRQIEGNTSIDNVVVTTGSAPIPEPATIALLGIGLAGLVGVGVRRKMKDKVVEKG